jgi:hypothetical protein
MHIAKTEVRLLTALLLCGSLFAQTGNPASSPDLKIVRTTEDASSRLSSFIPGAHSTTTIYVHGPRFRREFQSYISTAASRQKSGPPAEYRQAFLYQCDLKRVVNLDLETKLYDVMDLDANGFAPGSKYMSAEELDALLTKEDNERAAGTFKQPTPTVKIVTDYADTGERKQLYGFTARRVRISRKQIPLAGAQTQASESESDGWYVDLAVPSHCPTSHDAIYAKHHRHLEAVLTAVSFSGGDHHRQYDSYAFENHGQPETGFPFEITTTAWHTTPDGSRHASTSKETSVIWREPLDPALFEIPKDFARGKRSAVTGRMRPDNWVGDVEEWFSNLAGRISFYSTRAK